LEDSFVDGALLHPNKIPNDSKETNSFFMFLAPLLLKYVYE